MIWSYPGSSIWIAHKRNWWQLFRPLLPPLPLFHRLFFSSMVYFRPLVFYSVIWMNLFIATSSGVIETWLAKTNPGKFNCKFTKKKAVREKGRKGHKISVQIILGNILDTENKALGLNCFCIHGKHILEIWKRRYRESFI